MTRSEKRKALSSVTPNRSVPRFIAEALKGRSKALAWNHGASNQFHPMSRSRAIRGEAEPTTLDL